MCGSPQSLPRVPSCDMGATEPREEAASLNWLLPVSSHPSHSTVLLLAFKAFDIRDPPLLRRVEGLMGALPLPTWAHMTYQSWLCLHPP